MPGIILLLVRALWAQHGGMGKPMKCANSAAQRAIAVVHLPRGTT